MGCATVLQEPRAPILFFISCPMGVLDIWFNAVTRFAQQVALSNLATVVSQIEQEGTFRAPTA